MIGFFRFLMLLVGAFLLRRVVVGMFRGRERDAERVHRKDPPRTNVENDLAEGQRIEEADYEELD